MREILKKATLVLIFPSTVFTFAALPLSCSLARDDGIYKSDDSGANWQQTVTISKSENIGSRDILGMAIDPLNPQIILAGTKGNGLYRSLDGAVSWQPVSDKNNVLQKSDDIYDIAISQKNPKLIYLATYSGGYGRVLRSQDSGQSWEEVYVISQSGMPVNKVLIDPANDSTIFAGTAQGGFLKSTDFGSAWQALKWFGNSISEVKIDPRNAQIIYLNVAGKGMYKTTDGGGSWQLLVNSVKNFVTSQPIGTFFIDRQDSRILYASQKDSLLISYDSGGTWQKVDILIPAGSATISSLAQDPQNSGIIYYSAGSVMYRTTNYGQTWTTYQVPSSKKINVIKIDPTSTNIIYIGMSK
jgi:photosystem II stability/assembly factor-like uncharacterized protein